MIINPMDVLAQFPIRKTAEQKKAFREQAQPFFEKLGYAVKVEKGSFGAQNVVIGDPDHAKYLVTAHYDTPANTPWLMDEYVARALAMYYRSRHHACIIAFSLSNSDSGNGYNMYKCYEALKAIGDNRAIIYPYADGEWNSDI